MYKSGVLGLDELDRKNRTKFLTWEGWHLEALLDNIKRDIVPYLKETTKL